MTFTCKMANGTHDRRAYDRARVVVVAPPGMRRSGDLGSRGTTRGVPHRKPPQGVPTPRQRRGTRRHARPRVTAEHGIGRMKTWRVAAERHRNPPRRHTPVGKNVAGLPNRMFARPPVGPGPVR